MPIFPIMAVIEMFVDSSSHSLFPFEFILYAVYTIPVIIGAYIPQGIQKYFVKA
ncbi:MAG: hypothetical protein HQ472_03870 [Ignavibacteria bacterium]|nr:hypothetical protein [Ignavibacteria bacterium]